MGANLCRYPLELEWTIETDSDGETEVTYRTDENCRVIIYKGDIFAEEIIAPDIWSEVSWTTIFARTSAHNNVYSEYYYPDGCSDIRELSNKYLVKYGYYNTVHRGATTIDIDDFHIGCDYVDGTIGFYNSAGLLHGLGINKKLNVSGFWQNGRLVESLELTGDMEFEEIVLTSGTYQIFGTKGGVIYAATSDKYIGHFPDGNHSSRLGFKLRHLFSGKYFRINYTDNEAIIDALINRINKLQNPPEEGEVETH